MKVELGHLLLLHQKVDLRHLHRLKTGESQKQLIFLILSLYIGLYEQCFIYGILYSVKLKIFIYICFFSYLSIGCSFLAILFLWVCFLDTVHFTMTGKTIQQASMYVHHYLWRGKHCMMMFSNIGGLKLPWLVQLFCRDFYVFLWFLITVMGDRHFKYPASIFLWNKTCFSFCYTLSPNLGLTSMLH